MDNQVMKAVIYARVSTREQNEGYSIDAQIKLLREYATNHGMRIIKEFIDVESASKVGRQQFNEMISFIENHRNKCNTVLVEKTDRLTRNLKDYVTIDDLIQKEQVTFHLAKENEVLSANSNSHQKLIHGIKVLLSKNYSDNLSEEIQKGMMEKAYQGIFPSRAPIGYMNVRNGEKSWIEPDPVYGPFVIKAFELYATGEKSIKDIMQILSSEGLRSRGKGRELSSATFFRMLHNPVYYGEFYWACNLFEGKHAPLISKELWERVQDISQRNGKHTMNRRKHRFLFSKLLTCGHVGCGCTITAEVKKGHVYYHCTGHKGKHHEKYTREVEIDRQIFETLKRLHFDDQHMTVMIMQALKETHEIEKQEHMKTITTLQKKYNKIQNRLDVLYEDKVDGLITLEEYQQKKVEWRKNQKEIRAQLEKYEDKNINYFEKANLVLELAQRAAYAYRMQNVEKKREIINIVFSNLWWKDGKLGFEFNKPFDIISKMRWLKPRMIDNEKVVSAKNKIWWS